MPDWSLNTLPVRRIAKRERVEIGGRWPSTLPPVAQLLRDGLDLGPATILVGENGTGKSTLVEAIAMAFGMNGEGGSTGATHQTWSSESPLHEWIWLQRGAGASRWGYFIRAETMHGLFTFLDSTARESHTRDPMFHRLSHGEAFNALFGTRRFSGEGLYVLDEPEAGLSFTAQLQLVATLRAMVEQGGVQVLIATHSPIVASLPGARVLELDENGYEERSWDDLDVVMHYRNFCDAPQRYLRHFE